MIENKNIKRCSRCVLSSSTPLIEFDENGICNYCRNHRSIIYKGEEELLKTLEKYRNKNKSYDCIVAVSGGRDSSFTLLKLVKDYKMRVLAVNYENPFTDPQAKKNVENSISILNVDLVTIKPRGDIHRRTFRHNLRSWSRRPSLDVLSLMCIGCKLIWYDMIKLAIKRRIPLIVGGMNRFEDTTYIKALLGVPITDTWESTFAKSLFGLLKGVFRNISYLKPSFWPVYLKGYFFGDPYALGPRLLRRYVTFLDLFYYIEWNEKEILSRIKSELNWESSRKIKSTWRFDCHAALVKDLVYCQVVGVTEKDDFYSKMVREGIISRDEALARLEMENKIPLDATRRILAQAGLDYNKFLGTLMRLAAKRQARS
jgi:hypothetical protein